MDYKEIKSEIDERYVDDGRSLMMPLKKGWRWDKHEGISCKKEWQAEDEERGDCQVRKEQLMQ